MEERVVGGLLQDQVTLSFSLLLHVTSVAKAEVTHLLVSTNTPPPNVYILILDLCRWRRSSTHIPSRGGHSGVHDGGRVQAQPEGPLPTFLTSPLSALPHSHTPESLLQQS